MIADGGPHVAFSTEAERIATHLRKVREHLLARVPEGLSADQQAARTQLLDRLAHYANDGRFPQNHVLPYRNPVFIDPHGTACAVGWLMIESGHRDLAEEISEAMNLAYVLDMPGTPQWPAIAAWADEHGFGAEELAWIQPIYAPNFPWTALGGGTNGPVSVLFPLTNGSMLVAGAFTEAGGVAVTGVARWDGITYQPIGSGVPGEWECAAEFNGDLYLGGAWGGGNGDLAKWDGNNWTVSTVFEGSGSRTHALHVHNGELYAGGEAVDENGTYHRVKRWNGAAWTDVGHVFNNTVHALASFNNELIAGGAFTYAVIHSPLMFRVARFDGNGWIQLANGLDLKVNDLLVADGRLFACGQTLGNQARTGALAQLVPGQTVWEMLPSASPGIPNGAENYHYKQMSTNGSAIYLAGYFLGFGWMGPPGRHLASYDMNTGHLSALTQMNADHKALAVAVLHGRLVVGGTFDTPRPYVQILDISTSADEGEQNAIALDLFPNPTKDRLTLRCNVRDHTLALVELTDMHGRVIHVPIERQGGDPVLNVSSLASGMYTVRIANGERTTTQRFIKE
jgi:hypothetical protein